ncbi:hypothetical protein [Persicirhabdus sediminis]|uniref:hypothetical protein n=1 Tax=Persicirhabdus sediminis TaxID=454144 RepID=UPI001F1833A0|nr:hypothetical protein [Persicirhabdus sediminis]
MKVSQLKPITTIICQSANFVEKMKNFLAKIHPPIGKPKNRPQLLHNKPLFEDTLDPKIKKR